MFEHHFGLRENPFAAGHHAKFVYPSPEHQEAIAHLRYGIENREPFVLITGEVGTGKTTALFDALGEWQSRVEVALITNSALSQNELLEEIALRFGVPISGPSSKPQILSHLERVLAGVYARGDRAILLLDEAQNLERELLEEIRLLSNLERDGTKLLQVFLVGQPELEEKLARPELRQLRQRITVHYRLQPLTVEDTERYIHHRIMVAGGHAATVFPAKACREVFRITHGIPREINTLSAQSLLNAFVDDARAVAPAHVTGAAAELEFQSVLDRAAAELREHKERESAKPAPRAERARAGSGPPSVSELAASGARPGGTESGREDIDIKMIEAWMAELSRSKQGDAAAPPTAPSSGSATARAAEKRGGPPVLPEPPAKATEAEPVSGRPLSERLAEAEQLAREENLERAAAVRAAEKAAAERSAAERAAAERAAAGRAATERAAAGREAPSRPDRQPHKRDHAEEQRAALPPRLRAKLDDGEEEDLEDYLPQTRGRGMLVAAILVVALVVTGILLVRFGVITGLPFMPAQAPVPAVSSGPSAAQIATADSTARAAAADSAARAVIAARADSAAKALAAASAPKPAPKPASGATFGISVATFLDSERAETERVKLAASTKLPVTVRAATEGGTSVYHLVLGGFDSRAAAEDAASDLIEKGLVDEARIVPGPKIAKR